MVNRFVQKLMNLVELSATDVAALTEATANPRDYLARQDMIREGDKPGPVFVIL